jgi:hypothetical protein
MSDERKSDVLSAGRELDCAVARALGFPMSKMWPTYPALGYKLPEYSTDPAACSQAKAWLRERCREAMEITWERLAEHKYAYVATAAGIGPDEDHFSEYGTTEEEAIARLVLAVSESTEQPQ